MPEAQELREAAKALKDLVKRVKHAQKKLRALDEDIMADVQQELEYFEADWGDTTQFSYLLEEAYDAMAEVEDAGKSLIHGMDTLEAALEGAADEMEWEADDA